MAETGSNVKIWCCICELRKREHLASDWCSECAQALCQECHEQHKFSKSSKNHSTLSIADYVSLPPFIKNLNSYCNDHNKQLDLYCHDHKELCCATCLVVTHRECTSVASLQNILQNSTSEDILHEHCSNISDMCNFIRKVKDERHDSLSDFHEQIRVCQKQFENIRKEINEYIDQVQAELSETLNESYVEYEEESKQFLADLSDIEKKIEELELNNVKEKASKFQAFLASIELENIVSETKASVHNIVDNNCLKGIDLQILSNIDMKTPLREADLTNPITAVGYPSSVEYICEKVKHAQLSFEGPRAIKNISIVERQELTILGLNECNVVGCTQSSSGEYVFCDFSENRQILIFRTNGLFKRRIKTTGKPVCATFVNKDKLALTFSDECKVRILDFESGTVLMEHKMAVRCVGVKYVDSGLVVACNNVLVMLDIDGTVKQEIELPECCSPHLECIGENFIVGIKNEIHWLDKTGKSVQIYAFEEDKERIEGITADTFGNVFVSLYNSSKVVVLSKDGTDIKELIVDTDKPTGLCYDHRRNQLVAVVFSSYEGRVKIYDIKF